MGPEKCGFMQQRYYDPLCGCFLSTDPVTALRGSFQRYWYANANPYGKVDPDGREPGDPPNNHSPGPIDCPDCEHQPPPPPPEEPPPPTKPSCSADCMANTRIAMAQAAADQRKAMLNNLLHNVKTGAAIGAVGGFVIGTWGVAVLTAPETGGGSLVAASEITELTLAGDLIGLAAATSDVAGATAVGAGGLTGAAYGASVGGAVGAAATNNQDQSQQKSCPGGSSQCN